jgi:hypothetical protein
MVTDKAPVIWMVLAAPELDVELRNTIASGFVELGEVAPSSTVRLTVAAPEASLTRIPGGVDVIDELVWFSVKSLDTILRSAKTPLVAPRQKYALMSKARVELSRCIFESPCLDQVL